jgi:hypothetical protein
MKSRTMLRSTRDCLASRILHASIIGSEPIKSEPKEEERIIDGARLEAEGPMPSLLFSDKS